MKVFSERNRKSKPWPSGLQRSASSNSTTSVSLYLEVVNTYFESHCTYAFLSARVIRPSVTHLYWRLVTSFVKHLAWGKDGVQGSRTVMNWGSSLRAPSCLTLFLCSFQLQTHRLRYVEKLSIYHAPTYSHDLLYYIASIFQFLSIHSTKKAILKSNMATAWADCYSSFTRTG